MKRTLSLLMIVCMLAVLVLSGCSKDSGSAASSGTDKKPDKKPVTLKFWKAGNDVAWHDYWLKTIKEYESKNPGVKIEYAEAPFGQEIDTKLNAAYASASSPDIIMHAIVSLGLRGSLGQYEPLDSYLANWPDKADIPDSVYEFGKYKDKVYGMALYPVPALFAYRKDYFREAGLDPEKSPTTWEELSDYAVKLTKREKDLVTRSGMTISYDGFKLLVPFAKQAGAQPISDDGVDSIYNPAMVEALTLLTDLFKSKKVSMEVTETNENKQSLFSQGKSAMSIAQPSWIEQLVKNDPKLKDQIGFINLKRKQAGIWSGAEMLFLSSESKLKKEAWDFIQFAMSKDEVWKRYKETKAPVVRKSMMDQYLKDDPFMNKAIMDGISVGEGAPKTPWASLWNNKYLTLAIQESYYGKKTPDQALKDAQAGLLKEIQQSAKK